MDRRIGLAICAASVLSLTACGCARDQEDAEKGVIEYFGGCWDKLNSKRARAQRLEDKEKEAEMQNKIDNIKKNETEGK